MAQTTIPTVSLELTIPEAETLAANLGADIDLLNRLQGMRHATEAERTLYAMQRQVLESIWGRLLRLT